MKIRQQRLTEIKKRQHRNAALFKGLDVSPEKLSDVGHLCLVDVPWLLAQVAKRKEGS